MDLSVIEKHLSSALDQFQNEVSANPKKGLLIQGDLVLGIRHLIVSLRDIDAISYGAYDVLNEIMGKSQVTGTPSLSINNWVQHSALLDRLSTPSDPNSIESYHAEALRALEDCGLIETDNQDGETVYRINAVSILRFWNHHFEKCLEEALSGSQD